MRPLKHTTLDHLSVGALGLGISVCVVDAMLSDDPQAHVIASVTIAAFLAAMALARGAMRRELSITIIEQRESMGRLLQRTLQAEGRVAELLEHLARVRDEELRRSAPDGPPSLRPAALAALSEDDTDTTVFTGSGG